MGAVTPALAIASIGSAALNAGAQRKAEKRKNALEAEKIAAQNKVADQERQKKLRQAIATQRARFGASGISRSGSGVNVLNNLIKQAEDDKKYQQSSASLSRAFLDNRNKALSGRSLLDAGKILSQIGGV